VLRGEFTYCADDLGHRRAFPDLRADCLQAAEQRVRMPVTERGHQEAAAKVDAHSFRGRLPHRPHDAVDD
jgi:hypothetical protein